MNRLSGPQAKQLQQALLAGFSFDDLSQLVMFELDERLDSVVPRGPLSHVAFELVEWVERKGRTADLIKAVMAARPKNPDVAALAGLLQSAPAAEPATTTADHQRRLRGVLLDQFPRPSDLAMLVHDTLGLPLDQVAGGATQTEVCFNLVNWLWVDRVGRLRPLLAHAVQERPNSDELKTLQRELTAG